MARGHLVLSFSGHRAGSDTSGPAAGPVGHPDRLTPIVHCFPGRAISRASRQSAARAHSPRCRRSGGRGRALP